MLRLISNVAVPLQTSRVLTKHTRSINCRLPLSCRFSMSSLRTAWTPNRYPTARRADHVDVYKSEKHGEVRVVDPYQWLEKNTEETEQWVNAQEQFTRDFLDKNPDRQILEDEIRKNTDYARVMSPTPMLVKTQEPDRVSATFYSSLPQA